MAVAQLGETRDPRELIPGNPETVNGAASDLVRQGGRMESVGQGLGGVRTPDWTGEASEAFWEKFSGEKPKWFRASDAMSGSARALNRYASALTWSQSQAQEAIDLWERGEAATEEAAAEYNAAVARANARNEAAAAAGDPSRVTVEPFVDPGEKLRQQAQALLHNAREEVHEAATDAAAAINDGCGGPDAPPWLAKAGEAADAAADQSGGYSQSFLESEGERGKKWSKDFGDPRKPGGPGFGMDLGSVAADAYVWEGKAEGKTTIAGMDLAGSAGLQTLGVEGSAGLSVTEQGLKAQLSGGAYLAKASAAGSFKYGILGASAKGEAFAGAEASGHVTAGPQGISAGAEAFAGAKAEGSLSGDVGGIGAGVTGEAWAGAGVAANVDFGMHDGKFTIGGEVGAAVGIGGKVGGEITVDPGKVADTVGDAADAVGGAVSAVNPFD